MKPLGKFSQNCLSFIVSIVFATSVLNYTKHVGVLVHQTAPPEAIPLAQAHRGFANVAEETLEEYLEHKAIPLPTASESAGNYKLELALKCTQVIVSTWSLDETVAATHVGHGGALNAKKYNHRSPKCLKMYVGKCVDDWLKV